ncbi:MAG TPA: hypothetical protein VMW69_15440, partial [Spirochaetia bacterium]|nr:hypothetical protein [Spirochaetia bacterium]
TLAALLPASSLVYASIKVADNRQLISTVLKGSGFGKDIPASISDRTRLLLAAVQTSADGKPVVSMVASGDFPAGMIGWKLNWSGAWKRNTSPIRWWQEKKQGLQIAVPNRSLVLFSTGGLPAMLKNYTEPTEDPLNPTVQAAFDSSDLAIYFPTVSDSLPILGMDARRFPVDSFYFSISTDRPATAGGPSQASSPGSAAGPAASGPDYHGFAVFSMKSERDARLFSVVFKLLIASSQNGSSIGGFPIPLKGAQLAVDGSTIRLTGISLSEKDLAELVGTVVGGKKREVVK